MVHYARTSNGSWLWPTLSILMLIGMVAEAQTRIKPTDATPYLARCRDSVNSIPLNITTARGTWEGTEVPEPVSATDLLQPNAILSRTYHQEPLATAALGIEQPITLSFLLVNCGDARDMEGHYPMRCYPAQGQRLLNTPAGEERLWHLPGGTDINGVEYHFALPDGQLGDEQVVYNFFITPAVPGALVSHKELNGAICKDIEGVYKSGEDYQRRYYGASEFQMVFNAQIPREMRDAAFVDLLASMQDVITTLRNRPAATGASGGNVP